LTDEQKQQKKIEKKEAKQTKKANEAAGAAPPKSPKTPKGEKKAKAKAQAQGKGQGRVALDATEYYEDETHIYTYINEDMEYDDEEWYQDPNTGEWFADYSYSTTWDQ
jgi:outer membrane biosynthesis protein TonB